MIFEQVIMWRDLFSTAKMKPWWESLRSFTTAILTTLSLLLFHRSAWNPVSCIPEHLNATLLFGGEIAHLVNEQCVQESSAWCLTYYPWIGVACCGILFACNNFWEYIPCCANSVASFRYQFERFEKIDKDVNALIEVAVTFNLKHTSEAEKKARVNSRKLICELLSIRPQEVQEEPQARHGDQEALINQPRMAALGDPVKIYYKRRNVASIVFVFCWYGLLVVLWYQLFKDEITFSCGFKGFEFFCSHSSNFMMAVLSIIQAVILLFHLCAITRAAHACRKASSDTDLFLKICKSHGDKKKARKFENVIQDLNNRNTTESLKDRLASNKVGALEAKDLNFFLFYKSVDRERFMDDMNTHGLVTENLIKPLIVQQPN